jgi:hypothetical protein
MKTCRQVHNMYYKVVAAQYGHLQLRVPAACCTDALTQSEPHCGLPTMQAASALPCIVVCASSLLHIFRGSSAGSMAPTRPDSAPRYAGYDT